MADNERKPEVESLASLLAHPLLEDKRFLAAVAGLLGVFIFLAVARPRARKSSRRGGPAAVLLVGPSDGGKTSLFAQLSQNAYPQTHTSVQTSASTISLSDPDESGAVKQVKLVDLPGHPRLQDEAKKHIAEASAVVFVVDVVAVVRNPSTVSEQLPALLTALASQGVRNPSYPPPKVLLLAHKSDLLIRPAPTTSSTPPSIPAEIRSTAKDRLRSILTREMERLKSARASTSGKIEGLGKVTGVGSGGFFGKLFGGGAAVEDSGEGDDDETLIWGGRGPFRWEDMEGVEIEWGVSGLGAVKTGKEAVAAASGDAEEGDGLDELKRFLWDA